MSASLMPSRCLTIAAQAVAVGGDEHGVPGAEVGDDVALPVGEQAGDDVLEALGAGQLVAEVGVLRQPGLRELVVVGQRRRRDVEGAAPEHELLLAVLLERLLLVLALQGAVVALVEAPRAAHRDPVPVGGVEGQRGGGDRASLQRGVDDVGQEAGLDEQLPAAHGLAAALVGQVDVDPAGEEVLGVPLALAVAEQDERVVTRSLPAVAGRPRRLRPGSTGSQESASSGRRASSECVGSSSPASAPARRPSVLGRPARWPRSGSVELGNLSGRVLVAGTHDGDVERW